MENQVQEGGVALDEARENISKQEEASCESGDELRTRRAPVASARTSPVSRAPSVAARPKTVGSGV